VRSAECALGVDLPWSESGEAAVSWLDRDGWVSWELCEYPEGLLRLVGEARDVLVLLDIPLHGMASLGHEHFRPVDRALGRVGMPVRPSSSASDLGPRLAERLRREAGLAPERILEIYPYAIYKVLSYLAGAERAMPMDPEQYFPALGADFVTHFPLPYKRNSARGTRKEGMEALYGTLADPRIGVQYRRALPEPGSGLSLKRCADVYDSVLGAVLGLHLLRGSPWAVVKGTERRGSVALLADPWLSQRMDWHLCPSGKDV
jgi:predicted nuclease with RNAse H fold